MFERFARTARVAVALAQEEARDLGAREIRPEHLLIAVLDPADAALTTMCAGFGLTADDLRTRLGSAAGTFDDDAEALRAIGIDLYAVRDVVTESFGPHAFDNAVRSSGRRRRRRGLVPFSRAARRALELAVREAASHRQPEIRCEHLLLGILGCADGASLSLVSQHVDVAQLRAAVTQLLTDAA